MVFILGEGMLIFCAVTLASSLLVAGIVSIKDLIKLSWTQILLVALVTQISLYFNDLYDFEISSNMIELVTRLIQSIGMTSIILAVIYFLLPGAMIGRWIFFVSIIFLLFFLASWRFLYALVIKNKVFTEKAIILGSGDLAKKLVEEVQNRRDISYDIKSVLFHEQVRHSPPQFDRVPVRYGFDGICDIAMAEEATHIIVALDQKRGVLPYNELLNCKMRGLSIIDGESFYERITGKILVDKISPSWLIFSDGFAKSRVSKITKRFVGLIMSFLLLIMSSPIMLLIAIAVKIDSRGPVLFCQKRIGENEKIFTLYKFRSMRANAEDETGPVWASDDDPRVTRVGKIIRKLRLDELPQLWNVFKGDISFVGPRPERPFFVEKLKNLVPYYKQRFTVKPGITGWAQTKYGYGASVEDALEKLKYDLYYAKNMSWIMDLVIIFHTLKIVLLGRGAR
jgi:sugar transferase (PEP-CTERM system associated)